MPSVGTNSSRIRSRLIAGAGVLTSLVALAAIGIDGQPGVVSLWLLFAGLALAALSVHAMRRERAAQAKLDASEAERHIAVEGRRAAEAQSLQLAETSPDIVTCHDAYGIITAVSPACRDVVGYDPDELIGRRGDDFVHAEDIPVIAALRNRAREVDDVEATFRLTRRDGTPVWVEAKLRIVRDATGHVLEVHAILRDVHERVETQRALAEAEERFRSAFEEGAAGMAIVSGDGRILRVNRALCTVTGHQRTDLEGRTMLSLLHPDDRELHTEECERMLAGRLATARGERRYLHDDGHVVWVSVSSTLVRDGAGAPMHFLTQVQDITARRRYEAELRHMADHDALTGLLNRRAFERELERHVEHVGRYGARGAAVLLDVDLFKNVNDTLGHSAGDQLICKVADALREQLRSGAVIARLGGDEFAVLLADGTPEESESAAADLLDAVRKVRISTPSGRLRAVSASVGVAPFDSDRLTGEDVLVNADLAMYEAKESGRDRVATHGSAQDAPSRLASRLSWTDVIRDALDEERLILQAQPILDVASGEIRQYEMLLRMRDPLGELIPPAAFLPVAERYDLIGAIDKWVVRHAIEMLGEELIRGNRLVFEVNISGRSAGDPELLELIEHELRINRVEPAQVIFEITETTAVSNIPQAQEFAAHLNALGCRFALDDFGAAFASFYYLKHLPFDYLKIDGEFVRSCMNNRTDQLVIQAVVDIARGLGKRTVAEMVGDQETLDMLAAMGVDHAQGYHIGRPAPLAKWLVEEKRKKERGQRVITARA